MLEALSALVAQLVEAREQVDRTDQGEVDELLEVVVLAPVGEVHQARVDVVDAAVHQHLVRRAEPDLAAPEDDHDVAQVGVDRVAVELAGE